MNIKVVPNPNQIFYDKNGVQIKIGDKIRTNIDDQFLDGIIHNIDGKLGLFFKHADFFIKLDNMLDRFFETVEIIETKNNKIYEI
jgi:hypothetical protein